MKPSPTTRVARWWHEEGERILCTLCPRYCRIGEGQPGFCFIRQNHDGVLYNFGYGAATGFAVDPIEKKPLKHFYPGTPVLSFGTAGCNLGCKFCQNWSISKARLDDRASHRDLTPERVVEIAVENDCPSIAFTYNDPVIIGEWVDDVSRIARARGIHPVMVTAGYITPEAREEVFANVEAANVDLKAFSEAFYRKLTLSSLAPVLDTIRWLAEETDVWFELTNLIIPGQNDEDAEIERMCHWILEHVGDEVPVHFTAFHPDFKMRDVESTPADTIARARQRALAAGLKYVYTGNVHDIEGQTTYCPACRQPVITRDWHAILSYDLAEGNRCPDCQAQVAGVFADQRPQQRFVRPYRARV